jgi:hypothetical protein
MKKIIKNKSDAEYICSLIMQRAETRVKFKVEVVRLSNPRNLDQNALYWVWINYIVSETCGLRNGKVAKQDKEDIHNHLRKELLPLEEREIMGVKKNVLKSTKLLSDIDFSNYLSDVQEYAAKIGITLLSKKHPAFTEFYNTYK